MSERIRSFGWSETPLGAMETWPDALKISLSIAEHSAFPMAVYWGEDLRLLYNDPWAPFLGERHPWALGRPAREVWSDIWDIVGPQLEQVFATGEGISADEQMLPMVRDGARQETYWNYSFTPIRDASGGVAGIFNLGTDVTKAVLSERRLSFQVALADRLRTLHLPSEMKQAAVAMLGQQLKADRVGFLEVDEARDLVAVSSEWTRSPNAKSMLGGAGKLSDLPAAAVTHLRTGQVLAIADVDNLAGGSSEADAGLGAKLGVRAVITVPLVRDGKLRAMLFVHGIEVREWKRSEAALARDVAERSWAAVERAESEERLR
ncbi:MAG TPA: GAF domain-containing protein, partial [Allosphingosinicella sp.]|nr:GAF domain-containing protein [Allosphingosinicella sp.]